MDIADTKIPDIIRPMTSANLQIKCLGLLKFYLMESISNWYKIQSNDVLEWPYTY